MFSLPTGRSTSCYVCVCVCYHFGPSWMLAVRRLKLGNPSYVSLRHFHFQSASSLCSQGKPSKFGLGEQKGDLHPWVRPKSRWTQGRTINPLPFSGVANKARNKPYFRKKGLKTRIRLIIFIAHRAIYKLLTTKFYSPCGRCIPLWNFCTAF